MGSALIRKIEGNLQNAIRRQAEATPTPTEATPPAQQEVFPLADGPVVTRLDVNEDLERSFKNSIRGLKNIFDRDPPPPPPPTRVETKYPQEPATVLPYQSPAEGVASMLPATQQTPFMRPVTDPFSGAYGNPLLDRRQEVADSLRTNYAYTLPYSPPPQNTELNSLDPMGMRNPVGIGNEARNYTYNLFNQGVGSIFPFYRR